MMNANACGACGVVRRKTATKKDGDQKDRDPKNRHQEDCRQEQEHGDETTQLEKVVVRETDARTTS